MSDPRPVTEDELHAYVDGVLDAARHEAVTLLLQRDPAIARRVEAFRTQRDDLRAILGPIADEPVPLDLDVTRLAQDRRRPPMPSWATAAAVVLALAVGGGGGWALRGPGPEANGVAALAREASDNYRVYAADTERPVEMGPDQRMRLVSWMSDRLGSPVAPPRLESAGYRFMGGRLVTTPHGPAAMFLYDDASGQRLAVMIRPMAVEKNAAMSEHENRGVGGVAWSRRGMGYSLVADATPERLHPLADEIRRQLAQTVG